MAKKSQTYQRQPWEDQFNTPTVKQLRDGLPPRARTIFDRSRRNLMELDGVSERLAWYGATWKWAIEFHTKHSDEPLGVLVPSPMDLQLAMPLDREFISSLSMKRMKRAVRDGLELAQEPFDTHWGIWSLPAMNLLEDLQDLIVSRLRHLGQVAG